MNISSFLTRIIIIFVPIYIKKTKVSGMVIFLQLLNVEGSWISPIEMMRNSGQNCFKQLMPKSL